MISLMIAMMMKGVDEVNCVHDDGGGESYYGDNDYSNDFILVCIKIANSSL